MHTPPLELDFAVLDRLERLQRGSIFLIAVIAVAVQILWASPLAGMVAPEVFHMRPATGLAIILCAAALHWHQLRESRFMVLAHIAAAVVLALGVVVVVANVIGVSLQHLFQPPSEQSAVCFILFGASLLLMRPRHGLAATVGNATAIAAAGFVLFLLGSYFFGLAHFSEYSTINLSSPPTLICYVLIATSILIQRAASGGAIALIATQGAGGRMARFVMPIALVAPFLGLTLIDWLSDQKILERHEAAAVMAPLLAIVTLVAIAWLGLRINALEFQLKTLSMTDPLTGVLNRRGFDAIADTAVESAAHNRLPVRVYYFDLDDLKRINDAYGHDEGSRLISRFYSALVSAFEPEDIVARLGGDEFVVVTVGDDGPAATVVARVDDAIALVNDELPAPLAISYSVGHAGRTGDGSMSLRHLIALADAAMYARKAMKRAA